MVFHDLRGPAPADPAGRLRAAFDQHAIATEWPWQAIVCQLDPRTAKSPAGRPAAIRVDLTREDAAELTDLILDAAGRADKPPTHDGSADWIGTARVARMLDVTPSTIRGWVTRNGPKSNPFPQPDWSDTGRSFWRKTTIRKWRARQRRIEQQRRQGR